MFPIRELLWEPDTHTDALFRADWERVFEKVRQGRTQELSARATACSMGPCTKGATGLSRRPQPFGEQPEASGMGAETALHLSLYGGSRSRSPQNRFWRTSVRAAEEFEARLARTFLPFVGRTIENVADGFGRAFKQREELRSFGGPQDIRREGVSYKDSGIRGDGTHPWSPRSET